MRNFKRMFGLRTKGWVHRHILLGCSIGLLAIGGAGSYMLWSPGTETTDGITIRAHTGANMVDLINGQWAFLPGVSETEDGLLVKSLGLSIVEQSGKPGPANPALNLYGTHLEKASDFRITALMSRVQGQASLYLYARPPIVADEFRVERGTVEITVQAGTLSVKTWDGVNQSPATHQFPIKQQVNGDTEISLSHSQGSLAISIDNAKAALGTIPVGNLFTGGTVWFGLSASGGEWRLDDLQAMGINGKTFTVADSSSIKVTARDTEGLQTLATKKRPGFTTGAAVALGPLASDPAYTKVALSGNFGAVTPENAMKWQFLQPQPGVFNFAEADAIVSLARRHGLAVQGHTLVFGEANPPWVQQLPADQREAAMIKHIDKVVTHFKGKVVSWDVVNEPFDDEEWSSLRPHIWHQAMGESYITKAFTAARAADPDAKLFLNEYGIEEDGERWDALLALVTRLKKAGVPIDGVGFQAHVYEAGDRIDPVVLRRHMQQLAAIGVDSRISEMDVYDDDGTAVQSEQYAAVLGACLAEPRCVSWTTWGVSDRYDLFMEKGSVEQGHDFLWNENVEPTPAVIALKQLLR